MHLWYDLSVQDLDVPEPPYAHHDSIIHRFYWAERLGALFIFMAAISVNLFFFVELGGKSQSTPPVQKPAVKAAHVQTFFKPTITSVPTPSPDLKQRIPHLGIKIMIAPGWLLPQITPYPSSTSATITNAVYNLVLTKNPIATGSPELLDIPTSIVRSPITIGTTTTVKRTYLVNRSIVPNNYAATSVDDIHYPSDLPMGEYFNGAAYFTQESPSVETLGVKIPDIYPHVIHLGIYYTMTPDWLPSIENDNPDTNNLKRYRVMSLKDEVYKKAAEDMDAMVKSIEPLY